MGDPTYCYPWWHYAYTPLVPNWGSINIASGYVVNQTTGNVPANPEALRANAEQQLRKRGIDWPLTLDAYSLARNISSEVGSRSLEEQVALAETTVNQAKRGGFTVKDVILYRQPIGHPNRGYYGLINKKVDGNVVAAGTGRFTSTSQDPTLLSILVANLVLSGKTANFARGADDQDGPDAWAGQGQAAIDGFVKNRANGHQYWIGPLPGIDHWHTFLQITVPGINPSSTMGQQLIQRGIAALQLPVNRPVWPAALPVCGNAELPEMSPAKKLLVGAAIVGGMAVLGGGAWWLIRMTGFAPMNGAVRRGRLGAGRYGVIDDEWAIAQDAMREAVESSGAERKRRLREAAKIYVAARAPTEEYKHGVMPPNSFWGVLLELPTTDQFMFHEFVADEV